MTESIGWLAMSLACAVIGGALGVAAVHHRALAAAEQARATRAHRDQRSGRTADREGLVERGVGPAS